MSVVCEVYCVLCSRELNYYLVSSCFSLVYLRPIFFISCNGGVRSYSLSTFPPIFRPTTVVSEGNFPFYIFPFPPPIFHPATVVSRSGISKEGHLSRFLFFLHCLLFVVSKPDQTGEMDPSPDTAFPSQAAPPAPVQVTPPVVVLTREVDRKFFGDDSTRAQGFKEDIRRALDAQPTLSSRRRLDLILSNVGPKVKAEVSCLEADVQTDPEQVLAAIVQSFGESRSSSMLQQALLMTTQRQGESVRDYFHRAKEA